MKLFILLLSFFEIFDNVSSQSYFWEDTNYDCQLDYFGLPGVCKRFSECESAQLGWFEGRILPTFCYYNRFEPIVCCLNEGPVRPFGNGQQNQFPISTGSGDYRDNDANLNKEFPLNGNNQRNFPNSNNQFPIFNNMQQNRQNSNNQFPLNSANNERNFPNSNSKFPLTGTGAQNNPNSKKQFSMSENNQGNIPNTNNQFPNIGNVQQNRPSTNNQFPIRENYEENFPDKNNQFPSIIGEQNNRPPFSTENNPVNSQNLNNQSSLAENQISQIKIPDCTVVIIDDPNNPIDSPCIVPDSNQNLQDQTQFGQINTQNGQQSFGNTMQQNQPETSIQTQLSDLPEEEEFTPQRMSPNSSVLTT